MITRQSYLSHGAINYRLVGDGITDDSDALQALANGEPVIMPDGTVQQAIATVPTEQE